MERLLSDKESHIADCTAKLNNESSLAQLKEARLQAEITLETLMSNIQDLVHENARKSQDQQKYREKFNKLVERIDNQKALIVDLRRNAKTKSQLETCMHCGKPIEQTKHKRQKKFCSDKCRNSWWSANPQNRRPKKLYSHICAYCGTAFQSDRAKSKYCSVKCFADARRKENRI